MARPSNNSVTKASTRNTASECFLYIDETGDFEPGHLSAIGGLWADQAISPEAVAACWEEILGHPLREPLHANKHSDEEIARWLMKALSAWKQRQWQPFMIVHQSRQSVVDNPTTYVNVMADGLAKFARQQASRYEKSFCLRLTLANRVVPENKAASQVRKIPADFYEVRLAERISIERIRSPFRRGEASWDYAAHFASALEDKRLMLADLLCNAWYRRNRFPAEVANALEEALGGFTYPAFTSDGEAQISADIERGEYGLALLNLFALIPQEGPLPIELQRKRAELVELVAQLDSDLRDSLLQMVLNRIEDEIKQRRPLHVTESLVRLFREHVLKPICEKCSAEESTRLAWADASALRLALQTANYRGALRRAEVYLKELDQLVPRLYQRFERIPLALKIRFFEASYWVNSYDFAHTADEMRRLAQLLRSLFELMGELGESGDSLKAGLLGEALGSAMDALIKAARRNPEHFEEARSFSEKALQEFEHPNDLRRQEGMRSLLETDAGNPALGAYWLSRAVGLGDETASFEAIAQACAQNPFNQMHYVRLWEATARLGGLALAEEMKAAWKKAGLAEDSLWNDPADYPQQIILWKWGAALGYMGELAIANTLIQKAIRSSEADPENTTIRTLGLGAQCDRIAFLLKTEQWGAARKATEWVDELLSKLLDPQQPAALRKYFADWPNLTLEAGKQPDRWHQLAWDIPY